ncbi:MAG: hypothetical protein JRI44_13270 [Deltaproteobacteria bacterium]|nr:hypothetical protein [Deltaproteobacteria bacterium]
MIIDKVLKGLLITKYKNMKLTKGQVNKKYKDIYIEIYKTYDYKNQCYLYEIRKTSKKIRENMTLGQDVGTELEYRR